MGWTSRAVAQAADLSSFLQLFDAVSTGAVTSGGATYQCNSILYGLMVAIKNLSAGPLTPALRQVKTFSSPFTPAGFASMSIPFDNSVLAGSCIVVLMDAQFLAPNAFISVTDNTGSDVPFICTTSNNGHIPGESQTFQLWYRPSTVGGNVTVTVQVKAGPNYTAASMIIAEYTNLNLAANADSWTPSTAKLLNALIIDAVGNQEEALGNGNTGLVEPAWTGGYSNVTPDGTIGGGGWFCNGPDPASFRSASQDHLVGGPGGISLANIATQAGDLLLFLVGCVPTCPSPAVVLSGGGSKVSTPAITRGIVITSDFPALVLPYCLGPAKSGGSLL